MISQKAKYALRALVALCRAQAGEPVMISEISRSQAIPKKFLEQILLELKRAGLVVSRRGRQGGYVLLRSPDRITFGEVLRLIDGPIAPLPCLSKIAYRRCSDCSDEVTCEIRQVFARVAEATRAVLDSTTLADAVVEDTEAMLEELA
ncbi:MAG TPA: Rrf2 family transcriptional regulator [Alphaproteobacteria bacterium]|nr:Rrf2 family transcriptional regulator [Alphaproteobacteria bacterium]